MPVALLIEVTPVFVMVLPDTEMPVPADKEVRNAAQVVAPVALIVVTAFPAEQADAPPYEPSFPLASFKTSADLTEVFVIFVLVTCVVETFTVIGLVMFMFWLEIEIPVPAPRWVVEE